MEDRRVQFYREELPPGSTVQITTSTEQYIGEVVEITDYFFKLKTTSSNRSADILIDIEEAKTVKIISRRRKGRNTRITTPSRQGDRASSQPHHPSTPAHSGETPDQLFEQARNMLGKKDHSNAIKITRQLLAIDPTYPGAKELLAQCLDIARNMNAHGRGQDTQQVSPARPVVVQRESRPPAKSKYFALALQASSDEEAIEYLYRSIAAREPKSSSAIKDLANRLASLDRGEEAIDVLLGHRAAVRDQQSIDNLLTHIYIKLKRYEDALTLLKKWHSATPSGKKNVDVLKKLADCYIRLKRYRQAIPYLHEILALIADNTTADNKPTLKRLVLCYMQEQRFDDAERRLEEIREIAPDDEQATELHQALREARETGRVDERIVNKMFSDSSNEIGNFARFYLKHCEFRGVSATRLQEKRFDPSDIERLEKLAAGAVNVGNYNDGAEFYLSAANIVFTQEWTDKSDVYKYLYRSFASRGDASLKNKSRDTVQEWYCEALHHYDKIPHKNGSEKDGIKSIVKFLYSTLGADAVPLQHASFSIDHALGDILDQGQQPAELYAALTYLTSRSRRARQLILPHLFTHSRLRAASFDYLAKTIGVSLKPEEYSEARLTELWSALDKKSRLNREWVYDGLHMIEEFDLKPSFAEKIEGHMKLIDEMKTRLFFQLDRDRLTELSTILNLALRFFRETSFEQREYLCEKMSEQCRKLLESITSEPTRISVEGLVRIVEIVQSQAKETLDQVYASSEPQITLNQTQRHYTPDKHNRIVVQIDITNGTYCSPAESVELSVSGGSDHLFEVETQTIPLEPGPSLQGGDEGKFFIHLHLTDEVLHQRAFSLPVSVQYRTRSRAAATYDKLFHIELQKEEFKKIDPNPYAPHVRGTPVHDPEMFFGRKEFIENAARTIARAKSRAIVIYGQKRAGKSSILYHLKHRLQEEAHLLVAEVGSATTSSPDTRTSFLSEILWQILYAIKKALREKSTEGQEILRRIAFPAYSAAFHDHPSPLAYFQEILDNFREVASATPSWENVRIVLLIDEFQYIYELIKKGRLAENFMRQWKALLERNLFNAVLVGQNVMTKFRQDYPNEFDAMQDEPVSYLEDKDARALITKPIRLEDEERYDEPAIKRILSLTAGSPYYTQILCYYLVEHMNREEITHVSEAVVEDVTHNLLKGKNARFTSIKDFDNLISSGDPSEDDAYIADAVQIMACIAQKSLASPCPRKDIDCQIAPHRIDTILDDYVKRGVLQRDRGEQGQNYTLYVGLFQQWLNLHK